MTDVPGSVPMDEELKAMAELVGVTFETEHAEHTKRTLTAFAVLVAELIAEECLPDCHDEISQIIARWRSHV